MTLPRIENPDDWFEPSRPAVIVVDDGSSAAAALAVAIALLVGVAVGFLLAVVILVW